MYMSHEIITLDRNTDTFTRRCYTDTREITNAHVHVYNTANMLGGLCVGMEESPYKMVVVETTQHFSNHTRTSYHSVWMSEDCSKEDMRRFERLFGYILNI